MGTSSIPFGRYTLVERLAVGGMAELFLGTAPGEHGFQRKVVIKRLLPHLAREAVYTAMFIDEAKLTARLAHPKIAQTYELGRVGNELFIAMEFVDGVDVLAMLREMAWQRRRMPVELAVWVAHEVLDALEFAHNLTDEHGASLGVVHRDISPSNVLLSRRGDVKLVDFGIARATGPGRHHRTKSGTLKGKYGYMSPEQVIEQPVDARSDLFSVGVVLAEMLCGRRLFAAPAEIDVLLMVRDAKLQRLDQYGTHIPASLDQILRRALMKDPNDRYAGAAEMRDALGEWLYEEKQRVTPRQIGELVESLYDSAWRRRREAMQQAAAEQAAAVDEAMGGDGIPAPMSLIESMPVITMEAGDEPSVVNATAATALSTVPLTGSGMAAGSAPLDPMPSGPGAAGTGAGGRSGGPRAPTIPLRAPGRPSSAPPPSAASSTDIDITDLDLDAIGLPDSDEIALGPISAAPVPQPKTGPMPSGTTQRPTPGTGPGPATLSSAPRRVVVIPPLPEDSGRVSITTQATVSAAGFLDTDFGELANDIEKAVLQLQSPVPAKVDLDASRRYASIEDAISSVSPDDTDPGGGDFDDLALEDLARRSRPVELPSPQEIARAAIQAEPPALSDIADEPTQTGDFAVTAPITVLFRLTSTRATGLLTVAVGGIKKEIYLRNGAAEYVTSNMASELLGNYLVGRGALSAGELAMALAMMPHYGGKLGDTLVGLGLLKPLEVFRHLTYQVRQKLIDVCTWTKGAFAWYEGVQNQRTAFPLDLNSYEVLGAGAMALRDDTIGAWMMEHATATVARARARPTIELERFEIAGLPALYQRVDGHRTVGQIITESLDPTTQRRTARMLLLLDQCEIIRTASLGI